ncbi:MULTISPECIES: EscU/YscU/HrcU family type III secretion system export apparatus switch protein [Bacillaceae]|uniref:EscU/YscU/HrcU family type III secretion system export apparatus switch protein n=1 Tax=Evansella alkalicola TaxID=745819 RepID=A0ABS6K0A5_9BACI|nr:MULTISPECIES: EscU/YscU/HrcU family type III secretion system export apparatus switch protein [Bacillaceae]MBU9724075.1 EscU/YscU/HrcU family type III secretion system export apparatus switch protein [Bacillus alkalicola]
MMVTKHFNHIKRREVNGPSAAVIKYDDKADDQPKIVAQGKGHVAQKIIELAKEHEIPMEENLGLLENLIDMDLGDNIPPQLYAVMAEILLLLEEMEQNY